MWRDLRNAVRALAHTPTFTFTAVVALALAIGANGAIFGLVDALWFRPPGVRDPGTIVRVFATTGSQSDGAWSWAEYLDIRAGMRGFDDVAVRGRRGAVLTAEDGSQELLLVNVVSTNFFQLLGVRPALGRLFAPADEGSLQATPAIVLGHAFWRSYFGGDPSVVGRRVRLGRGDASTVTVLGVLPRSFRDLEASADRDLWMPPATWERITGGRSDFEGRENRWFEMVARRRADAGVHALNGELGAISLAFARDPPDTSAGRGARVVGDLAYRMELAGVPAKAMLGLVLLIVVITCVNVANLLLARSASHAHELAIRVALGAGRWRLVRQLSAESFVLGILGALGGTLVAAWFIRLLPSLLTTPPGLRSFLVFQLDLRVMLFTAGITLLTTLLFGLAPALIAGRADVAEVIRASTGASERAGLFKRVLVSTQVAVSLVMLCVAVLLVRSYIETQRGDIGFERRPVLTLWTTFGNGDPVTGQEAVRQLRSLPGVTDVAVAVRAPLSLSGGGLARPVRIRDVPASDADGLPRVKFNAVSANYFDVLGTRLLRGRPFMPEEERGGEATVVVNEQFADQYLPGREPLGSIVEVAGEPHRIIGIAQNGVVNEVGERPQAYMYLPFWRGRYGEMTFMLAGRHVSDLAFPARGVLRRISPQLEPRRAITMAEYLEYATSLHRATAALATVLGSVGLILTIVGVYGVVAYRTTRRTREIGIRIALGAKRGQVVRLVLRDGLTLGIAGVLAGIPLASYAERLTGSMLVGSHGTDALLLLAASVLLLLAVTGATMVPARRASRVEPALTLKE